MLNTKKQKYLKRFASPWEVTHKPFRVADDIYYVGNTWANVFLLNTEKGLVLIDCAVQETLYLLVDSIRAMGFDPHDIKALLLTHGHFDHCGAARALQEMSGCEIWCSKEEMFYFTERRDLIHFEDHVPEFRVDHYYDYSGEMDFGNFRIKPVLCPGHTPGTTSFFFDAKLEGQTVRCGLHGGLGTSSLDKKTMLEERVPLSTAQTYADSIEKMLKVSVDLMLPSHNSFNVDYDFFALAEKNDCKAFLDAGAWQRMLTKKLQDINKLMQEDR